MPCPRGVCLAVAIVLMASPGTVGAENRNLRDPSPPADARSWTWAPKALRGYGTVSGTLVERMSAVKQ